MENLVLLIVILGYCVITLEGVLRIDKTATALLSGVGAWIIVLAAALVGGRHLEEAFAHHLGEIAAVVFFLLGAMTIVELVDRHHGFDGFARLLSTPSLPSLVWRVSAATFFLSAILDNLTTTIAMCAMLRSLVPSRDQRLWVAALIVIAANAGGAWSPMGDVTTSMLWIGSQVSTMGVISATFVPSLAVAVLPVSLMAWKFRGVAVEGYEKKSVSVPSYSSYVLGVGLAMFLLVPLMTALAHIPPVLGMLFALGVMWIVVGIIHRDLGPEEQHRLGVAQALRNVDTPTILFFTGLLLAISALSAIGTIGLWAGSLSAILPDPSAIAVVLGVASGLIDNIPLVAAAQKMFDLQTFGTDHPFWNLLALTTGTGGSMVIFGSAAGVAVMGMEDVSVGWYLKRISMLAALGFAAGVAVFLIQHG